LQFRINDNAICPYYKSNSKTKIKCCGLCGKTALQEFGSEKKMNTFLNDFCLTYYWQGCDHAATINEREIYDPKLA